ncbi:CinA family nicotinamide mononucleotide deamidase-related protein [Myroides odoratimimus]|uniref:CinA family nicotinamide mononucleotide deamidase-related protein n=1 Tax=Myroides odoratimimus TaxID=76832 RepID=UPI002576134F|nr:CinA family nicotinamide mononucleotide deamidase-related protein [Myroides odoratimimus]MDM1034787.1 CinA family nicotinamide mononucleotide deamidase-related protein [Myroides odoratimimus]MDM1038122.1 CinA family nicotinamide mononucleotide deamidase-related protein [Myroides odoratimimus]MDM1052326.1 CinA family nicotinamide mononucleotide deamidase-related protein [Myroides odoratimimus]MDM1461981.1 CinA family nicotinamide mononucleotide deamidase-related protein [Myroides odoratimimus
MKASIITIGDEMLIGQIVDTNSVYLAKELDLLGFEVAEIITISDKKESIEKAMSSQMGQVDLVIMTGGLGPTKDDVTKKVFCDFFEDHLVIDEQVLAHVTTLIENYFKRPISEVNKQQALVPSTSTVLFNTVGTAPGMLMQKNNTTFVSFPGVPLEMKTIFSEQLVSYIKDHFKGVFNIHKTIITYGIGESLLAEYLEDWENNLPSDIKLAYLPSPGKVRLRLSSRGSNQDFLSQSIEMQIDRMPESVKAYIRAYEDIDFPEIIIKELQIRNKTISFAESCTGGRLAVMFNAKPGSSAYFKGGMVCYATESKVNILGVNQDTINKYTVVSEEVAMEMAEQARLKFNSDYAIATTGNAGPSKGDSDVEVGTVCIGIATPTGVFTKKYELGQPREKVINSAIAKGLELIYNEILKK